MGRLVCSFVCVMLLSAIAAHAAAESLPKVTVFGASWCGPCAKVKEFLTRKGVPFEWLDVDIEANRASWERANDGNGGIPLIMVGGERIRGCNLRRLGAALGKTEQEATPAANPGEEVYGDHPASWWLAQFVAIRARLKAHKDRIAAQRRMAQYNDELELVKRLEGMQKPIEQALNQLEIDASEVSLPRKYRAD